jgi:hypothetical protein
MAVITNLSKGPIPLELNSGDVVRMSPGARSESIPDAELRDNPKITKLLRRRAISVATDDEGEAPPAVDSAGASGAGTSAESTSRPRKK